MSYIKHKVKSYLKSRGFYQELLRETQALHDEKNALQETNEEITKLVKSNKRVLDYQWFVEPGHFYSPLLDEKNDDLSGLVDLETLKWPDKEIAGIKLDVKAQTTLLKELSKNLVDMPDYTRRDSGRYWFGNDQFGYADGTILFLMLRHLKPKNIVEVGSGWSSAMMLDVNEIFPKDKSQLTFIDPYPERLLGTLKKDDKKHAKIIDKKVQLAPKKVYDTLESGDILFIDNSHVSKSGSDVNYVTFEVLPKLKKGVYVHIHDIFYPFEYPKQWLVDEKRNWNEAYIVRSLLIGSSMFEVVFWESYLYAKDRKIIQKTLPGVKDLGASIWLRKIS